VIMVRVVGLGVLGCSATSAGSGSIRYSRRARRRPTPHRRFDLAGQRQPDSPKHALGTCDWREVDAHTRSSNAGADVVPARNPIASADRLIPVSDRDADLDGEDATAVLITALSRPERLWTRAEVLVRPSPVPPVPGVYGWHFTAARQRVWTPTGCYMSVSLLGR
jgi:hypothetical protein